MASVTRRRKWKTSPFIRCTRSSCLSGSMSQWATAIGVSSAWGLYSAIPHRTPRTPRPSSSVRDPTARDGSRRRGCVCRSISMREISKRPQVGATGSRVGRVSIPKHWTSKPPSGGYTERPPSTCRPAPGIRRWPYGPEARSFLARFRTPMPRFSEGLTTFVDPASSGTRGDASLFGSTELRVYLARFFLLFPIDFGVFGLTDVGRVFADGESSGPWHGSWGGGVWLAPINRDATVHLSVARHRKTSSVYAGMGFAF